MPPLTPRDAALHTVTTLRQAGHVAYFAGGCVRDKLLGLQPKDYDVATDAPPETVRKLFPRSNAVGAAFGVVLVYHNHSHTRITTEVATFRADGHYTDGRRPDHVTFTDAKHDAQRRDFTINGLFEDPLHPEKPNPDANEQGIIDYVAGIPDLQTKTLRAIGTPDQRFAEDYLRMLRAVRFAARFDFTIEKRTADAIRNHAPKLDEIARERIGDEIRRALSAPSPEHANNTTRLIHDLNLYAALFNEPSTACGFDKLKNLDPAADYATRLIAWLDTDGNQPETKKLRTALNLSNDELDQLRQTRDLIDQQASLPQASIARRKRAFAHPRWPQAMLLLNARSVSGHADPQHVAWLAAEFDRLANDGIGLSPPPLLTGDHLVAADFKPGPAFKTTLDAIYDAQLQGRIKNHPEALELARTLFPQN